MVYITLLIALFLPLLGFLILMSSSTVINRKQTGWIGCGTILISFLCFFGLLIDYTKQDLTPQVLTLFPWIHIGGINADFTLRLDPLSLVMTLIITGVGFLIHLYSNGYMEHDEDYARYFSCMNFFVFSMLLLVLAGNLLLLFVGWEGVGLASYLLIGYYYYRPAAAQAATKAFVVNRIGDFGFLVGILLTFYLFKTTDITEISIMAGRDYPLGAPVIVVLTLLYFVGAVGKSAQLPLQTWLPDAMEGPTPVSALIHAATMVTAGVYLVVRVHPVFMVAPTTLHLIGAIGGVTSLFAALAAVGQIDLKRVLAYSTISQLGLMFLACGIASFYAAMFHLMTHAFMKALLFLSAGNVIHMMQGTTDMQKMGGLDKKFPITHWLFLIGVLAMAGIPPLSAFFSKDLILEQEHLAGYETLFVIALLASILTAYYLMRAYWLTFKGHPRLPEKILKSVHEAPRIMIAPVVVLAFLAVFGGFIGFAFGKTALLEGFLAEVGVILSEQEPENFIFQKETLISVGGGLIGVFGAIYIYLHFADRLWESFLFLRRGFYFDEIYDWIFVRPLKVFAGFVAHFFEPRVFDGSLRGVSLITQKIAGRLQEVQSGEIRSYIALIVVGAVLLIISFIV